MFFPGVSADRTDLGTSITLAPDNTLSTCGSLYRERDKDPAAIAPHVQNSELSFVIKQSLKVMWIVLNER